MKQVAFSSRRHFQCSKFILLWLALAMLSVGTAAAAELRVIVQDTEQAPLSGIKVYAYTQAGAYAGSYSVTDDSGTAGFGDVGQFSAGTYKFKALWLGHDFWVENIDLPATTEATLVIPTAPVTAAVTAAGLAVGGVKVYLFSEAGAYLSRKAVTDDSGRVMFALPQSGTFKLRVDILGSQYWSQPFQVTGAADAVAIDAGGGRVSVTLQKDATHPMAGVKMYLFNTAGSYLGRSLTTDSAGLGQFDVPAGTYRIRADYLGYQFWSADTAVTADTPLDFTIAHQDIALTVNGQLDAAGPIEGAKVYLFTEAGSYVGLNQVSDDSGRVSFSLPDRTYKARADYMNGQFWSEPFRFQDHTLTIPMAEAEVSVLWGGAPLAGVPVYLFTPAGSYTGIRIDSGTDGICLFQMPAGQWKFRADYQTNQYWTADVDLPAGVRTPVELSTGGGAMIFGVTLYQNEEQPLEGVNCYVFNENGSYTGLGSATNSQGQVQFDLAAGQYQIRVDYLGYQFWSELYDVSAAVSDVFHIPHQDLAVTVNGVLDTPEPLAGLPVYLFTETGQYLSQKSTTNAAGQVVFTLPDKAFKVRVDYMGQQFWSQPFTAQPASVPIPMVDAQVLVTGAGHGLEGVTVYAFNENQSYLNLNGVTDSTGQVTFRLPAGAYLFRTSYLGHTFWSQPVQLAAQAVQPVEIAAGGGAFTFTLLADQDQVLANTKCYLFNGSGGQYLGLWRQTDENGQLNFELVDGTYTIRVDHLGYPFFTEAFQVPQTLDKVFTIAHVQVPVTVNGVLGAPTALEGVKVYLFNAAGAYQNRKQVTDSEGKVYFSLPPKDYKVRADYLNHQYWSPVFNQTPANVNIPQARTQVNVQGVGEPLEGIKVYVFTESGGYIGLNAVSNDQGRAEFVLPAQHFKFRADYQGSQFWSDIVDLTAGQLNTITIDTGGGTLQLRIEKDAYHPLQGLKCYVYSAAGSYLGLFGTTDMQGQVNFKLAQGRYKIKFKYAGYDLWTDELGIDQDLAHTVTIAHLRRNLHVQAINPGPEPLQDLTAYVYTGQGAYIGLWGKTDADGNVAFDLPQKDYQVKVVYNGQDHWSQILQPNGNLITINCDGTAVLPPVAAFNATVTAANQVQLSWTPPADTNGIPLGGYHLYRRRQCQGAFERLDSVLIPADAVTYTDVQASPPDTYLYYIAAVSDAGVQGYPSPILAADFNGELNAENTTGINDLTASWQQGVANLTWSGQDGCTYQVFRGETPDDVAPRGRSDTNAFSDTSANPYQTWYYQAATIKTLCDPATGQPIELLGPLSALTTLAALTAPTADTDELRINSEGQYVITTAAGGSYTLNGTYDGFEGPVTVTAVLGDLTVTGTGADGVFSIELPSAGNWQIIIGEADGWQTTTIDTQWRIDDQPPSLSIDGAVQRSTCESTIQITGLAEDAQSAVQGVSITSDRFSGTTFGTTLAAVGNFSGQVPLKTGANILTVTAGDIHGNAASTSITVTQTLSALPVVRITAPANGSIVYQNSVQVAGTVRSSLPPEQIRMVMGEQVVFPAGSDNEYSFSFASIDLLAGSNIICVRAETAYGNVSAQSEVTCSDPADSQSDPPRIEVLSPLPDTYLTENPVVTGLVTGKAQIASVQVNGQSAQTTGLGTAYVSFQAAPGFAPGEQSASISITATDATHQSTTIEYDVYLDNTPPLVTLQDASVQAPPAVNSVTETPYRVSGTIMEKNISGASLNEQPVSLSPASGADTYSFSASLPLTYGQQAQVTLMAWDLAGNRTGMQWIVQLDSDATIEVIAPRDGAQLPAEGDSLEVTVTVRIAGAAAGDIFKAAVDGGSPVTLARSGTVGSGTINVSLDQDEHSLEISLENAQGNIRTRSGTHFSTRSMADVPLVLARQTPANGAGGIEPNDFMAFYFNKRIDSDLLQIQVLETAHGLTYGVLESGADITQLSRVELVEVHREREAVPGSVSHFPGNHMAAFYPDRDLAYGAEVFITVIYDGHELARSTFKVRDLPTFIEGFVLNSIGEPVEGIELTIAKLGLASRTDRDGAFGFGFKTPDAQNIPAGRYKLVVNPDLQNPRFGIVEQWVNAQQGRLNSVNPIRIPVLNPTIAFRRIGSGATAILAEGALTLDLAQAELRFPDLRNQGDVHTQMLQLHELSCGFWPYASPRWVFASQPAGIKISGTVGLTMAVPAINGGYGYLENWSAYVILVGLDEGSLTLAPMGIGRLDSDSKTVTSLKPVALERLDYIGYALMPFQCEPHLKSYANDEIDMNRLILAIEQQMQ